MQGQRSLLAILRPTPRCQSKIPDAKNSRKYCAKPRYPHRNRPHPQHKVPTVDDSKQIENCDDSEYGSRNHQIVASTHFIPPFFLLLIPFITINAVNIYSLNHNGFEKHMQNEGLTIFHVTDLLNEHIIFRWLLIQHF